MVKMSFHLKVVLIAAGLVLCSVLPSLLATTLEQKGDKHDSLPRNLQQEPY